MKSKILSLILTVSLGMSSMTAYATTTSNQSDSVAKNTTTSANTQDDFIVLNKEVTQTQDENGEYQITLESFITGEVAIENKEIPTDIILVLDQSGSMAFEFDGYGFNSGETPDYADSRQVGMQKAVADFIISVGKEAKANNVDHKVGLVTFGENSSTLSNYSTNYGTGYTWKDSSFTNTGTDGTLVNKILTLPKKPSGATNSKAGMNTALNMLKTNIDSIPKGEKRNQVVIMFTDGTPTTYRTFSKDVANGAIAAAYDMQEAGATVYTVGIFDGASATGTSNENKYMNYTSSNYPKAQSMWNTGSKDTDANYYLTAKDATGLSNIFKSISEQVSKPSISLNDDAVLSDTLSFYFEMPDGFSEEDVIIQNVPCKGEDGNGNYIWGTPQEVRDGYTVNYDEDSKTITVKGFDYSKHFVSDSARALAGASNSNYYGSKLVVSFDIKPIDGFIGGNKVPTNAKASIELEGEELETVPTPTTDVPIKFDPDVEDITIYRGNSLTVEELFPTVDRGYLDDFVTITSDTKEGDKVVTALDPVTCTDYTLAWSVDPIYEGTVDGIGGDESFKIHVLQPKLEVNDLYVNYGTSIDMSVDNVTYLDYKTTCGCDNMPAVDKSLEKPELSIEYTSEDGSQIMENASSDFEAKRDYDINAEVFVDGQSCDVDKDFKISLNRFQLNLSKIVDAEDWSKYGQNLIVNVTQNGVTTKVVFDKSEFDENGTVTKNILDLYAGVETVVTEDVDWSWRWEPTYAFASAQEIEKEGNSFTLKVPDKSKTAPVIADVEASITNEIENTNWISLSEMIRNVFGLEGGND